MWNSYATFPTAKWQLKRYISKFILNEIQLKWNQVIFCDILEGDSWDQMLFYAIAIPHLKGKKKKMKRSIAIAISGKCANALLVLDHYDWHFFKELHLNWLGATF